MTRRRAALLLGIGPALALAAATPAIAGTWPTRLLPAAPASQSRSVAATVPDASPSARAGFAAVALNSLDHSTSYNSSGGAIGLIHTPSSGLYTVTFGGQSGFIGGDVQVSTQSAVGTCSVES
jgi:hypothetical protein